MHARASLLPYVLTLLSSLTLLRGQAPATVFEQEPNGQPELAHEIALGSEVDADLAFAEQDWYRFRTTGGNVALFLSGGGATAVDARISLFDKSATVLLAFSDDTRTVLPALHLNLEADTYYVRVDGFSATSSGPYFLDTAIGPIVPFTAKEVEPNDTAATAMPVGPDWEVDGKIGPSPADVDCYQLHLPTQSGVWIQVTDGKAPCVSRTRYEFCDALGQPLPAATHGAIGANSTDFDFRISEYRCWPAGDYCIRVLASTSTGPGPVIPVGNYRLVVKVLPMNYAGVIDEPPADPGPASLGTAVEILPGARAQATITTNPLDSDMWRLHVVNPCVVMYQSTDFGPGPGPTSELVDSTLTMFDADGTVLDVRRTGNILVPNASHGRGFVLLRDPGDFYIRVAPGPQANTLAAQLRYAVELGMADLPFLEARYRTFDVNTDCRPAGGLRPTLEALGEREVPELGTVFRRHVRNAQPGGLGFLLQGNLLPQPFLLSPVLHPQCGIHVLPLLDPAVFVLDATGGRVLEQATPFFLGGQSLRGLILFEQVVSFPASLAFDPLMSNYAQQILGDRSF